MAVVTVTAGGQVELFVLPDEVAEFIVFVVEKTNELKPEDSQCFSGMISTALGTNQVTIKAEAEKE